MLDSDSQVLQAAHHWLGFIGNKLNQAWKFYLSSKFLNPRGVVNGFEPLLL